MIKAAVRTAMWTCFLYTLWRLRNNERSLLKNSNKDYIIFNKGVQARLQGRSFLNDRLATTGMFALCVFYLQIAPFWILAGMTLGTPFETTVESLYYFSVCLLVVQTLAWLTSPAYLFFVASIQKSLASKLLAEAHPSMRNWILTVFGLALILDFALVRLGWIQNLWAGFLIR